MVRTIKYTKDQVYSLMKKICDEYKIRLRIVDNKKEAEDLGWALNCGACSGKFIMISYFTIKNSLELKLISFFHEFAHVKLTNKVPFKLKKYTLNNISQMQYEMCLSYLGIKFAKEKYDIVFSDDAVKWLLKENMTYSKYNEGEYCKCLSGNKNEYILEQEIFKL